MIFLVTGFGGSKVTTTTTTTLSDSYNTYNTYTQKTGNVVDTPVYYTYKKGSFLGNTYYKTKAKPYYTYKQKTLFLETDYKPKKYWNYELDYFHKTKKTPKYSSKHKYKFSEGFFGSEINEYKVYVTNEEHRSGYYTVKFYLKDYDGNTRTEYVTHYLEGNERKLFKYKNVFDDDYDYAWNYKVVPQ